MYEIAVNSSCVYIHIDVGIFECWRITMLGAYLGVISRDRNNSSWVQLRMNNFSFT